MVDINLEDPLKKGAMKISDDYSGSRGKLEAGIKGLVSENAVLIFGRRGCCMCHVMKRLLLALGVNPTVYEVIDEADEISVINELLSVIETHNNDHKGNKETHSDYSELQFPAVYIGGKLFGGLDRLMGAHITGELIPKLKQAGALWL
ncbi:hypothetical protein C5167_039545 [Papaver somniferum]|uniref:Glutaredoxin domain-containing protein n=1 Tax=Papaver somniferum TaxID=3469 RepID=A0A4Y7IFW9_PAPSO|nr:glutaredoxin-C9-like [Papaver somniferum]RZC46601.1 hypothetical protein C5167_039545 [Papaver somniferum]